MQIGDKTNRNYFIAQKGKVFIMSKDGQRKKQPKRQGQKRAVISAPTGASFDIKA